MNLLRRVSLAVACLSLLLSMIGQAGAAPSHPFTLGYGEAAVTALDSRLPEVARAYGLSSDQLTERLNSDRHLAVDSELKLFYSEATLAELTAESADPLPTASAPAALASLQDTFLLHSRAGSQRIVYLDFDGHLLSGTVWNYFKPANGGRDIICPPWDIDGQPSVFGDAERTLIQQVWQRVAEDYAPFDVDVTTEYPGEAALTRSNTADAFYGMRVLISPISSAFGSYGGIAYVGVFDAVGDYNKPALVFPEMLSQSEKNIGEAGSHENGHTLGLYHDGTTSGTEYYAGHGTGDTGWAPIMGNGYYKNLTQWSKGEYAGANNKEDDLAVMLTNGVGYRTDDHGDTGATATPLPAGGSPSATGFIGQTGEPDVFSFIAGAGPVTASVTPAVLGANLDTLLELRDAAGTLLTSSNPVDGLAASLSATVSAGTYYVTVKGTGKGDPLTGYSNYASLGAYTLSATLTPPAALALTVTAPNGGESWANGSAHNLSWTLNAAVSAGAFNAWLIDGVGNWVLVPGTPAVPGQATYSVPWTVSAPARADYKLTVWYRPDAAVWGGWLASDQSNATFAVTAAPLTVTAPNGAETWANGSAHNLAWTLNTAVSVGAFNVWLIDGVGNWIAAVDTVGAVPGQTTYSVPWTVVAAAGAGYRLTVWYRPDAAAWGGWAANDQSDATFTVTGAALVLTVTAPNGGQSWANGSAHNLDWALNTAVSVGAFNAWFIDGVGNWIATVDTVAAVPGQATYSVPWTVTAPARADYKLTVWYRPDLAVWGDWAANDQSDATFAVTAP